MNDGLVTWGEFKQAAPELAASGERMFKKPASIVYLATVDKRDAPRVHPVSRT